jgi:4a-hydroxytetrahydrobiopterin dehydratase
MNTLAQMKCIPCREGAPTVPDEEIAEYRRHIPKWEMIDAEGIRRLQRVFPFADFAEAMAFTNQVGKLAETEDHHPAIVTEWGKVTVTWWTHKIKGLHRNDFILAAKTDDIYEGLPA